MPQEPHLVKLSPFLIRTLRDYAYYLAWKDDQQVEIRTDIRNDSIIIEKIGDEIN